ncbi:MAG: Hpt domain-containing protein [Bdellovibrionales bacterium]|nr:Hpt domain-containing protein [Bdellovibrionales bacterium]
MGAVHIEILDSYFLHEKKASAGFVHQLAVYFSARVQERLVLARSLLIEGQRESVGDHLHALKNAFLNVGALDAADDCQELENQVGRLSTGEILSRLNGLECSSVQIQNELRDIISSRS